MSCIFCKIVAGEIPAKILHSADRVIAIEDIDPQAPTHILIIPKTHFQNAAELALNDRESLISIFDSVNSLTKQFGLTDYRMVFNTGAEAGQTVFHAHLHVLAGRALGGLLG